MQTLTAEQRRELIERPFPIVRVEGYRRAGVGTTFDGPNELVAGNRRNYQGAAFHINRVLYGEEYYRWS